MTQQFVLYHKNMLILISDVAVVSVTLANVNISHRHPHGHPQRRPLSPLHLHHPHHHPPPPVAPHHVLHLLVGRSEDNTDHQALQGTTPQVKTLLFRMIRKR